MFCKLNSKYIFFIIFLFSFFSNFSNASLNSIKVKSLIDNSKELESKNRKYIVGAGDLLNINFVGINEFSGDYFVGPDGIISLPEVRGVYVQDMTIDEIYLLLNKKYSSVLNNPNIFISVKKYRPVQIFIKGEVKRPGLYTLLGTVDAELSQDSLTQ